MSEIESRFDDRVYFIWFKLKDCAHFVERPIVFVIEFYSGRGRAKPVNSAAFTIYTLNFDAEATRKQYLWKMVNVDSGFLECLNLLDGCLFLTQKPTVFHRCCFCYDL